MIYYIKNSYEQNSNFFHGIWSIQCDKTESILKTERYLLIVEGFIFNLKKNKVYNLEEILELTLQAIDSKLPFNDEITGQFNIVLVGLDEIYFLNDFCGSFPLYYSCYNDSFTITNADFFLLKNKIALDNIGLLQSLVGPLHISFGERTLFKNFKRQNPGVCQCFKNSLLEIIFVDNIEFLNKKITNKSTVSEIDLLLKENANIYSYLYENIVLPISGGVDSRITLSSSQSFYNKVSLISYGEPDYIDNVIASKIAEKIGLPHSNVSFKENMFPRKKEIDGLFQAGGQFFINSWFSVKQYLFENNKLTEKTAVLLGDIYDLLRAKNVKSIRSRKKRIIMAFNSLIGKKEKLNSVNEIYFLNSLMDIHIQRLKEIENKDPRLFEKLKVDRNEYLIETKNDLKLFLDFLKIKSSPKYQENLEEIFYLITWGARVMIKQASVFKDKCDAYVMMGNRHVVKSLLMFNPIDRFEDILTHKLVKMNKMLSNFPTSQVPFMNYGKNLYLKYIIWLVRSGFDQVLIKLKSKGLVKKERIVKHIEWQNYYKSKINEEKLLNLLEIEDIQKYPLKMFKGRASGDEWPLSEVDINSFVYPSYLMKKIKNDI